MSHILPSEGHDDRVPRHTRPGEWGRIIIWAGLSNLLLIGLIYSGMNREAILPLLKLLEPRSVSAAVLAPESRMVTGPVKVSLLVTVSVPVCVSAGAVGV